MRVLSPAIGCVTQLHHLAADKQNATLEENTKRSEALIPIWRCGELEEFAKAAVFLASSANTYLAGQWLVIDGRLLKAL